MSQKAIFIQVCTNPSNRSRYRVTKEIHRKLKNRRKRIVTDTIYRLLYDDSFFKTLIFSLLKKAPSSVEIKKRNLNIKLKNRSSDRIWYDLRMCFNFFSFNYHVTSMCYTWKQRDENST